MKGYTLLAVLLLSGYQIRPTEALAVGDLCTTNYEAYANPDNNIEFYYCLSGILYLGECETGQYFDSSLATCTHLATVAPGTENDIDCANNDYATYPYPLDSSRYYYCLDGEAQIVQCPANNFYNPYLKSCTTSSNLGPVCPASTNTMLANPTGSCQNYILCLNGQPSFITCPDGYYFQANRQSCGKQIPSNCAGSKGNCTVQGQVKAIGNNCQAYNYCTSAKIWATASCQTGYYFSPERLICGPTMPKSCNTNYNYNDINYPAVATSTSTVSTTTGGGGPVSCANNPDGIFPDYNNCRNYYVCLNGVPYSVSCPTDYYFNPITQSCSTSIPTTCTLVDIDLDTIVCPANAVVTVADPNNCKQYVVCTNGVGVFYACGPGLYYNIVMNQCVSTIPPRCV